MPTSVGGAGSGQAESHSAGLGTDNEQSDNGRVTSADPLGDAASTVFDDLAQGDVDSLVRRSAPYQHDHRTKWLMLAAGRDPACTPVSEIGTCGAVAVGLLFTAGWQIVAVMVAAQYELGFATHPVAVGLVAIAIAIIVVIFDWSIIHSHVRQEVDRRTWITRGIFTLCMILLVSEVVALAIFDRDIQAQLSRDNGVQVTERQRLQSANADEQEVHRQAIRELTGDVGAAENRISELEATLENEAEGLTVPGGEGPRWQAARLELQTVQQQHATAEAARDDPASGVAAHEQEIADLEAQAGTIDAAVPISEALGPAQREALLWAYLIDHPSALFLKRIPLFVVLVCLDLFALLLGLAVSRRTRYEHSSWDDEQGEQATTARIVRAQILTDAKAMIGNLTVDGLTGGAEQRARRARQRRLFQRTEENADDRIAHEARMRAMAPYGRPGGPAADTPQAGPQPRTTTLKDTPEQRRSGRGPRTNGAPRPEATPADDPAGGDEAPTGDLRTGTRVSGPESVEVNLENDPAAQTDDDVDRFITRYDTDVGPVEGEYRLDTAGMTRSQRATLLLGRDAGGRWHVVKIFSVAGATRELRDHELTPDARNAEWMTRYTGGLAEGPIEPVRLAPGHFGMLRSEGLDVPYLVMPHYPSGNIKDYIKKISPKQLTLDWCLRVSEQMFLACAELAERQIVGCDAKLSNFVFGSGAHDLNLAPEHQYVIGPTDPTAPTPDPHVLMIDLSMVYIRDRGPEEIPTRTFRGTLNWSSPRALRDVGDRRTVLSSLDDAYSVAVNTIYLLTERKPPFHTKVALESLGGGDRAAGPILVELSTLLHRLADSRGNELDDMLVDGRAWLKERGESEERACAIAAVEIRRYRERLASLRPPEAAER